VVLTGSGAGQYQQLDKATATGGKPQNGQQPCSLWPPVWATVTAASGGLKRWEKLSFRAVDLPPDDGAELCPDERLLALGHWLLALCFSCKSSIRSPLTLNSKQLRKLAISNWQLAFVFELRSSI
jgi:hypothetical protein